MITQTTALAHPELPGVQIFPFEDAPKRGLPQSVLVVMEPGATIPPHTHMVEAVMHPVAGSATVLAAEDDSDNGRVVCAGFCVRFAALGLHGFQAGDEGFSFVSVNGGIVDNDGDWDIDLN